MQSEIVNAESQDLWEAFVSASIFAQVAAGSFVLGKFLVPSQLCLSCQT